MKEYDYRNCQSLFGYATEVHQRSGGVCQLCDAGATGLDFDLWRQLTVASTRFSETTPGLMSH